MQRIDLGIYLDGVTPTVRYVGLEQTPIIAIGDPDLAFPSDPEAAAAIALDFRDAFEAVYQHEIKKLALRDQSRTDARLVEAQRELIRQGVSPAEVRHERLTEGVPA